MATSVSPLEMARSGATSYANQPERARKIILVKAINVFLGVVQINQKITNN